MRIDYKQLEVWLHEKLKHLCPADPVTLAQYLIALLKKDKSEEELKTILMEQLDVFLTHKTAPFVETLFDCIKTQAYSTSTNANSCKTKPSKSSESNPLPDSTKDQSIVVPDSPATSKVSSSSSRHKSRSGRRHSRSPSSSSSSSRRRRSRAGSNHRRVGGTVESSIDVKSLRQEGTKSKHKELSSLSRRRSRSPFNERAPSSNYYRHHIGSGASLSTATTTTHSSGASSNSGKRRSQPKSNGRCRDFEERGFCIYGDQCRYDHGPNALVLHASSADRSVASSVGLLPFPPPPLPTCSSTGVMAPTSSSSSSGSDDFAKISLPVYRPTPICENNRQSALTHHPTEPANTATTTTSQPSMPWLTLNESIATNQLSESNSLVAPQTPPPAYEPDHPQLSNDEGPTSSGDMQPTTHCYKPSPIAPPVSTNYQSPILFVSRLPWSCNNINQLTRHFAQFGPIVDIQCELGGQRDLARVEFESPSDAQRAYRSPDPIMDNRFIRLAFREPPPAHFANSHQRGGRGGRGRPYWFGNNRGPVRDRLGNLPPPPHLPSPIERVADFPQSVGEGHPMTILKADRRSRRRWRLERRRRDGSNSPSPSTSSSDTDGEEDRRTLDNGCYQTKRSRQASWSSSSMLNQSATDPSRFADQSSTVAMATEHHQQQTDAYLWQQRKAAAIKQRQEQIKLLDKTREARQAVSDARLQRSLRLTSQLKAVMARLDNGESHDDRSRLLMVNEAKRIQIELEQLLAAGKVAGKQRSRVNSLSTDNSTAVAVNDLRPVSSAAIDALPEPMAVERRKQLAEVKTELVEAESQLKHLKASGEPVAGQLKKLVELKRKLVTIETVKPVDFFVRQQSSTDGSSDSSRGVVISQTKLDKRPRTLYILGLTSSQGDEFKRILSLNYLHTQAFVKHPTESPDGVQLEITFCTRDFAEATIRNFSRFRGQVLRMAFEPLAPLGTISSSKMSHLAPPPPDSPNNPTDHVKQLQSKQSSVDSVEPPPPHPPSPTSTT